MKSKQNIFIAFLLFVFQANLYSQLDTIKGQVFSSITLKRPTGEIYIFEKSTSNGTIADSLGYFYLIPLKQKTTYDLEITVPDYDILNYQYKAEWTRRKRPKSIVINVNCEIDKNKAKADLKNNVLKLYVIGGIAPIENSKKDLRFEKKFNIKYQDFGCDSKNQDCLLEYNNYVFKILDIKYMGKWRKKVRKDVVGIEKY